MIVNFICNQIVAHFCIAENGWFEVFSLHSGRLRECVQHEASVKLLQVTDEHARRHDDCERLSALPLETTQFGDRWPSDSSQRGQDLTSVREIVETVSNLSQPPLFSQLMTFAQISMYCLLTVFPESTLSWQRSTLKPGFGCFFEGSWPHPSCEEGEMPSSCWIHLQWVLSMSVSVEGDCWPHERGLTQLDHGVSMFLSTSDYGLIVQEPSSTHRCECSRARKIHPGKRSNSLGLNVQVDGVRKRPLKKKGKKKNPSPPPYPRRKRTPLLRTGVSADSGDELNLRHLHCRKTTSLHDHRDVHNRRNCTCGTSEHLHNRGIDTCRRQHNNGHVNDRVQELDEPNSRRQLRNFHSFLHCLKQAPDVAHNGHVNHLLQELHLWNLNGNDATATLLMNRSWSTSTSKKRNCWNKSLQITRTSTTARTTPSSSMICSTKRLRTRPGRRPWGTNRRPTPANTIREPTLGLPGDQDWCNNDRRIALHRRVSLSRRRWRSTDKSSGQLLRRECYPSSDSSRCTCRLPG